MLRLPALIALAGSLALPALASPITSNPTITSGGLVFNNFTCTHSSSNPGLTGGSCGTIDVASAPAGIALTGGLIAFSAGPNQLVDNDFVITYQATAAKDAFSAVGLSFDGQLTGNGIGAAEVVESVYADPAHTKLLGQTHVSTLDNLTSELALVPPTSPIYVVKDIQLAVNGPRGRVDASISFIDQTFNTTPEPASLALLGTGLVGIGLARRRRMAA